MRCLRTVGGVARACSAGACRPRRAGGGPQPRLCGVRRRRWAEGLFGGQPAGRLVGHQRRFLQGPCSRRHRHQGRREISGCCPPATGSRRCSRERSTCCPATSAMTSTRDTSLGVRFPGVLVYDGQGFMVRKSQNITSALELSGARICVTAETADEQGIIDYFAGLKMPMELMKFAKWSDAVMAYAQQELHGAHRGHFRARARPPGTGRQRRSHHSAGNGRPAADRTSGSAGGRRVVQHRALDPVRSGRGRGTRHHLCHRRCCAEFATAATCAAFSGSTWISAGLSASAPTGRNGSSARSATTASCSIGISGRNRL